MESRFGSVAIEMEEELAALSIESGEDEAWQI